VHPEISVNELRDMQVGCHRRGWERVDRCALRAERGNQREQRDKECAPPHLAPASADSVLAFLFPLRVDHMDTLEAIQNRRSIRQFTDRPVTRAEIEALLTAAVAAPNHRMTQPWRFYVLGPSARHAFGTVLGSRKAKKIEDPAAAQALIDKVAASEAALPAMLMVGMTLDENLEIREEDYAATMMAIQNLLLAAQANGLGTHVKSGAVMDDPRTRAAVGVPEGQRIIAMIQLGEPAAQPEAKVRRPASELTNWLP
jgi:nitroreductase